VHPDFDQTDPGRLGQYADLIAEMDYRVGQILDCIDQAGLTNNTVVVFSSDNAAGGTHSFQGGSNGPFRGAFVTPPCAGWGIGQGAHRPADRQHRRFEVPARGERDQRPGEHPVLRS
jgi:arylsulfatase A-like enzyme